MIMEDPVLKDYIIGDIIREVEQKGLIIEKVYVENFIDNFINEYERLPKKNEIKPIVSSYLKTLEVCSPTQEKHSQFQNQWVVDYVQFVMSITGTKFMNQLIRMM